MARLIFTLALVFLTVAGSCMAEGPAATPSKSQSYVLGAPELPPATLPTTRPPMGVPPMSHRLPPMGLPPMGSLTPAAQTKPMGPTTEPPTTQEHPLAPATQTPLSTPAVFSPAEAPMWSRGMNAPASTASEGPSDNLSAPTPAEKELGPAPGPAPKNSPPAADDIPAKLKSNAASLELSATAVAAIIAAFFFF